MVQERLRAVFYARVSTEEEKQLNALEKQIQENRDVISNNGWELIGEYIDEGKTGTTTKRRSAYKRLLADMTEKELDRLEGKRSKLLEAYLEDLISKEDYKEKYEDVERQIEEKKKLLLPVEENEDIKDIEAILKNIDQEIDTYIASLQFENSKVDFLIEHTKRITVLENSDIIIELDIVAGAIIAGKDFLLYVHESMQINHGRKCFYVQSKNARPFRSVFDRQFCNKYRGDWESTSQRNSEQAERSGNTTGSAQSEADYVGGL